ncbi:MAG: hypothetical protein FWD17_18530 [Polyangiaceae bacterium]|nr:hypothetical protein [Polyangiaceae bacterium]
MLVAPAPTESEWQACAKLWTCMVANGLSDGVANDTTPMDRLFCGESMTNCSRGLVEAHGPCAQEVFDAFELNPSPASTTTIMAAVVQSSVAPGQAGFAAEGLFLIANRIGQNCITECAVQDAGAD